LRKLNEHTSAQNLNAFVPYFKIEGTGYKIRVAIATAKVTSLATLRHGHMTKLPPQHAAPSKNILYGFQHKTEPKLDLTGVQIS